MALLSTAVRPYTCPDRLPLCEADPGQLQQEDQDAIALKEELTLLKDKLDEAQAALTQQKEAAEENQEQPKRCPEILGAERPEGSPGQRRQTRKHAGEESAAYAATLPKANDIYAKAVAEGADFDALIKEYNEDAGQRRSAATRCSRTCQRL